MTVLHLDPGVLGFMLIVAAVIGTLQLIDDLLVARPPDVAQAAVWAGTVLAICLLSVPFSFLWTLNRLKRHGWVVGYFDETATLLVHADANGSWEMSDHHAAKRGRRLARPFRQRVFRHLAEEADRHGAVIVATTLVPKLASRYQADMPGLAVVDDRRRDPIGRRLHHLRREPAQQPGAALQPPRRSPESDSRASSRVQRWLSLRPDRATGSPTTPGTALAA